MGLVVFLGATGFVFDKVVMPIVVGQTELHTIPNVRGLDSAKALAVLQEAGLEGMISSRSHNPKVASGLVVSQHPYAGRQVKGGRVVYLTVSKGQEKIPVPDLKGLDQRSARVKLMMSGLEIGAILWEFSEEVDEKKVSRQSPAAGTPVPWGSYINLTMSKGREMYFGIVPDLVGLPFVSAERITIDSGFVVGTISHDIDETFQPGTVLHQYPAPGTRAQLNSGINLTVSAKMP